MDPAAINERLTLLTAEVQQLRIGLGQLVDAQEDTTAGLVALDKNHAVSDAKSDLRAERLVKLEAQIDKLAADLAELAGPVRAYFDAQNQAAMTAAANRANLTSYLTPARIGWLVSTIFAAGAAAGWWHSTEKSTDTPVHETDDAGTVDE